MEGGINLATRPEFCSGLSPNWPFNFGQVMSPLSLLLSPKLPEGASFQIGGSRSGLTLGPYPRDLLILRINLGVSLDSNVQPGLRNPLLDLIQGSTKLFPMVYFQEQGCPPLQILGLLCLGTYYPFFPLRMNLMPGVNNEGQVKFSYLKAGEPSIFSAYSRRLCQVQLAVVARGRLRIRWRSSPEAWQGLFFIYLKASPHATLSSKKNLVIPAQTERQVFFTIKSGSYLKASIKRQLIKQQNTSSPRAAGVQN